MNSGLRTDLLAGSQLEVSWFMAYPHQGGFRVELMDDQDNVIQTLAPNGDFDNFTGLYDQT